MGGAVQAVTKVVDVVAKTKGFKFFQNPLVQLGATLFLSWVLRPKTPEISDFGTNSFDDFEKGLLVNKQSNDINIPVVYGERLVGGSRILVESSGTDNEFLYIALVLSEGEINDITEIRINDQPVTWSADLADNTQVTVNSSDSNYYKDGVSLVTVEPHYGSDGQSASSL